MNKYLNHKKKLTVYLEMNIYSTFLGKILHLNKSTNMQFRQVFPRWYTEAEERSICIYGKVYILVFPMLTIGRITSDNLTATSLTKHIFYEIKCFLQINIKCKYNILLFILSYFA